MYTVVTLGVSIKMLFIRGPLLYVLLYGVHSSVIDLHHQLVPGSSSTAIKVPLKCDRRLNVIYNFSKRFSSPEKCEFENHSRDITWIFTVVNVYQNEYGGDGVWVLSFIYFFFVVDVRRQIRSTVSYEKGVLCSNDMDF